jgi:uncharacterized membrane protein
MAQTNAIPSELSSFKQSYRSIPGVWRLLLILCLIAGIVLRFVNIEGKVFQHDETFTLLRVSGYTEAEVVENLSQAGIINLENLEKYQQINPEKNIVDTVNGLAVEEPQLTPFYFILAKFWTQGFGSSIAAIRWLSAIASLLAFPCLYWLCLELFESALAGWIGVAVLAVSPFQLLYAQEVRPFSLWTTTILLSSAALLRAMRLQTRSSWLLYAISNALNLYTYLFSGFVVIVHLLYVAGVEQFRLTRRVVSFAIACGFSLLAFSPWILVILANKNQINHATRWTWTVDNVLSLAELCRQWLFYLTIEFVDIGTHAPPVPFSYFVSFAYWLIRLLVLYGLYLLCRKTHPRTWLFVLLLIGVPALGLILPDLMFGGTRFLVQRYLIPLYLGFHLAISYLLSRKLVMSVHKPDRRQKVVWQSITAIVLSAALFSCGLILQADTWWNKMISHNNPNIAQIINQSDRPLVISDTGLGDLLSLSHYLDPKVDLLVRPYCYSACQIDSAYRNLELFPYLPPIPPGYSDVFLFYARPQPVWKQRLAAAQYHSLEVLANKNEEWLWKIKL